MASVPHLTLLIGNLGINSYNSLTPFNKIEKNYRKKISLSLNSGVETKADFIRCI